MAKNKEIKYTLSKGQYAALELDIVDVDSWLKNISESKAFSVIHQLKTSQDWTLAIANAATNGIDVLDDDAVLINAIDKGIIKKAADKEKERIIEEERTAEEHRILHEYNNEDDGNAA